MEYRTLNNEKREIRLLTVERTSIRSKYVTCKLHRYSMDRLPPYTALSYCWGDPTDTVTMIVNGKKLSATRNLEAALRQISRDRYSTIWADAICINQDDNNERNHQILYMREIYSAAECVVAWLGPETPSSTAILSHLKSLEERKSEFQKTLGDWGIGILAEQDSSPSQVSKDKQAWITFSGMSQASREERREVYTDRAEIFLDRGLEQASRVNRTIMPGFEEFFDRPYWTRVWIIQEVAVASRVIVYCGSKHTKMENIEKFLVRTDEGKKLLRDNRVPNFSAFRKSKTLVKLLMSSRSSLATDPRDKVYALLGLSSDSKLLMNPDYQKPLDSVLEELTRNLLLERKCANILLFRSAGRAPEERVPSWIPDWLDLSSMNRPWHSALAGPDGKIPRSATERFMLDFEFPRNLPGSTILAPVYNRLLKPKPVFFGTETPEWKEGSSLQQWIFAQDPCLMNSDGPNMPFIMPSIKIRGRILKMRGYIIDQVDGISAQAVGREELISDEELERRDMLQPLRQKSYYTKPPIIHEDWDNNKKSFTYNESITYKDERQVSEKRPGSRERSVSKERLVSKEESATDEDSDISEGSVVDEESHEESIANKTTARAIAESFSMQRVDFGAHIGWGTRCSNPLGLLSALRKVPKDSIAGAWIKQNLVFVIADRTIEQWMQYSKRFVEFKKMKKPVLTAEEGALVRKADIDKELADGKQASPTVAADKITPEQASRNRKIAKAIEEQSMNEQKFKARQIRYMERVAMVIGCGMRLITTEAGRVGMVHPQTEDEDLICHLRGCAMPVVLRRNRVGKGYHVVGEAYLWPPEDFAPSSLKVEEFKNGEEVEFAIE